MKTFFLVAIVLVVSMFASAEIYNPCNSLDEFSTTGYAEGDWGIHTPSVPLTPNGGTSFFFTPRPANNHTASWNFADVAFVPGDTFSFDIKNAIGLGTANVDVRYILDDGSGGDIVVGAYSRITLSTGDWVHVTCNTPAYGYALKRIDFSVVENTKVIDIDNLNLITNYPGDVDKGPFHNPCSIREELSAPGFAADDVGITLAGGPDGSNCFFFTPRSTNSHTASWNFNDVTVYPGDTFTFDIKNTIALGTAHVDVRYIVDDGSGGETIIGIISGITLSTNDWVHITLNMPTTSKLLKRIDWSVTENTKVIELDNLEMKGQLGTGLYTYGPIYNPCDDTIEFTFDEGGIVSDLDGNHVNFIPRSTNSHSLSWNIGDINVTPTDFMAFDVKNDMAYGNATLTVNLFWRNSLGNTGVTGPMITGLTDGHLIDSAGWKHCRVGMPPFPCTITGIVFGITENTKIVTLDNLAISPEYLPQTCDQVNAAGLGLYGDITGDCYVDMNDVEALAFDWVQNTDPYSPNHVIGNATPTNKIVRGTAVVDGSIAEWTNQVEWVPLDKVLYGTPTDVNGAKMALRWNEATNKIYAAVVVPDTTHVFRDSYLIDLEGDWDSSDRIEVFSQGDAVGGEYTTGFSDAAQQYFVGHKTITTGGSWVSWPFGFNFVGVPDPNFEYAVSIEGNNLVYEVGVQMYDNYAGRPGSEGDTIITDLSVGKFVGFDIVVDTRRGNNLDEFGVLAANSYTAKAYNASNFQTYTLIEQAECGALGYLDGDVNEDCYVDFEDFAELALRWLQCNNPTDLSCIPNW